MSEQSPKDALAEAFASGILDCLQDFWFSHLEDETHIIVPSAKDINVWFVDKSEEFDESCRDKFGSVLNLILSRQYSANDIVAATNPDSALDWMSLIILLDQMPRNCYRGMGAAKVFNFFDPLALAIALRAKELGIHQRPDVRYRLGYRLWLFMPFEHAEDMQMQEVMIEEQKERFQDVEMLMHGEVDKEDVITASWREVLMRKIEEFGALRSILQKAVDEHYAAIRKFGRFPYRNVALGRSSSQEEQAFLDTM
ncbi:DUF924-domain-containing protein [Aureobasidium namibiae CBS 147.97]|uniref:DUF924-domain-containing protein n=1 Tax=Aureobasidium namibiae CBS 147.97 TaxID=1043004 RepID=A0A074WSH6_9PEZI